MAPKYQLPFAKPIAKPKWMPHSSRRAPGPAVAHIRTRYGDVNARVKLGFYVIYFLWDKLSDEHKLDLMIKYDDYPAEIPIPIVEPAEEPVEETEVGPESEPEEERKAMLLDFE